MKEARNAEMALLCGSPQDAEAILLTAGLIFRAIMLNIQLYNWDRYVHVRFHKIYYVNACTDAPGFKKLRIMRRPLVCK